MNKGLGEAIFVIGFNDELQYQGDYGRIQEIDIAPCLPFVRKWTNEFLTTCALSYTCMSAMYDCNPKFIQPSYAVGEHNLRDLRPDSSSSCQPASIVVRLNEMSVNLRHDDVSRSLKWHVMMNHESPQSKHRYAKAIETRVLLSASSERWGAISSKDH